MNIHVDIRRFLEIHAWICYGFSDQGEKKCFGINADTEAPAWASLNFSVGRSNGFHLSRNEVTFQDYDASAVNIKMESP